MADSLDADAGMALRIETESPSTACPGGAGCACVASADCDNGICLVTATGGQCARPCDGTCACIFVSSGGDLTPICRPESNLCAPCVASTQCADLGNPGARCVRYATASFCGVACQGDEGCGPGHACVLADLVEPGEQAFQCMRVDDQGGQRDCGCSEAAVKTKQASACWSASGSGWCPGVRTCTAVGDDGLGACVAAPPKSELCNAKDDDCDGETDEGTCDDGNACTTDGCDPAQGCHHKPVAAAVCDDGNPCTGDDGCVAGSCVAGALVGCDCLVDADCAAQADLCLGKPTCNTAKFPYQCASAPGTQVVCPVPDGPCLVASCTPTTGACGFAVAAPGTACTDGDPCTAGETCAAGACQGGTSLCQCKSNADCAAYEDGNFCNGMLYCADQGGGVNVCKVNPATVVDCGDGQLGACEHMICVADSGQCTKVPLPDGATCTDGDKCTGGDVCSKGACTGSANVCLCSNTADCASQEDGNLCNGTLFCNKAIGKCQINPKTIVHCPSATDTACAKNTCQPMTGLCAMTATVANGACDDGNACTTGEACVGSQCVALPKTCTCTTTADCAAQEDGNQCNGTLYCHVASATCKINPATVKTCLVGDDTACLQSTCQPATGLCKLQPVADGKVCDDGSPCNGIDTCAAGKCAPADPKLGCSCQTDKECSKFDDGDLCNGTLMCNPNSGLCEVNPATVVVCPAGPEVPCQPLQCEPQTGLCASVAQADGTPCSDGNPCTGGDACAAGKCLAGPLAQCLCASTSDCAALDDTNLCNGQLHCLTSGSASACVLDPKSVVSCAALPDTKCAVNSCDATTGKCAYPDPALAPDACQNWYADSDGDGFGDSKKPGQCLCKPANPYTASKAGDCNDANQKLNPAATELCNGTDDNCDGKTDDAPCNDNNPCTTDACTPQGCKATANAAPCDDGNACTVGDLCASGSCKVAPMNCNDANSCTIDGCAAGKCLHQATSGACDDGNLCTVTDQCQSGICKGTAKVCGDNNPCTSDSCSAGNCVFGNAAGSCSDGSACTTSDACVNGKCAGAALACSDGNPCTSDTCVPSTGCKFQVVGDGTTCSDGNGCTKFDVCKAGKCAGSPCSSGTTCTGGTCKKNQGLACTASADCSSGWCVDSYCCDSGCSGLCKACSSVKTGKANGSCNNVLAGLTDSSPLCASPNACNGSAACEMKGCYFFVDSNFGGASLKVMAGAEHPHLKDVGFNDKLSSQRCLGGAVAWLYEHAPFAGQVWTLAGEVPSYHTGAYGKLGDNASSIRVK